MQVHSDQKLAFADFVHATQRRMESLYRFAESLSLGVTPFYDAARAMAARQEAMLAQLTPRISAISERISRMGSVVQEFIAGLEREAPLVKQALGTMTNAGWYRDLQMTPRQFLAIAKALEQESPDVVDPILCDHFESRLADIEESLCVGFPGRTRILRSAFAAHRGSQFELSIPVLLAQADGICMELASEDLFRRQRGEPSISLYVQQLAAHPYRLALLEPLVGVRPIGKSQRERGPAFDGLNRHLVLHGESVDYPTEANGYKAISLLFYVATALGPQGRT